MEDMEQKAQRVHRCLFSGADSNVYAVVDGASSPDLQQALYTHQPEYECLYRGELEPDIAEVAPYLVRLEPEAAFTQWVIERGWGAHWGVFAVTDVPLDAMRRHFRKFLVVHDAAGRPLLFRYYDPRVLRVYLPTCTAEELATVFGPVHCFVCEDKRPAVALRYQLVSGALDVERLDLAAERATALRE